MSDKSHIGKTIKKTENFDKFGQSHAGLAGKSTEPKKGGAGGKHTWGDINEDLKYSEEVFDGTEDGLAEKE